MSLRHVIARSAGLAVGLLASGCDIDQSFLFPEPIEGVPGVQDLGMIKPVELTTPEEVADSVIYGELGPTGAAEQGGLTFQFEGVSGDVCVWIDPETVFWNQSVSPTSPVPAWSELDNVYDDGDLDLFAGLSVYYTGTPGERIGDFQVRYEDSIGNTVPVDLVACVQQDYRGTGRGHAGRAFPEFCTIQNTLPLVRYTVMLQSFSVPLDDDRLGYGLLLTVGPCSGGSFGGTGGGLIDFMGASSDDTAVNTLECVITGESIEPGHPQGDKAKAYGIEDGLPTWIGGEVPSWKHSTEIEKAYCNAEANTFCRKERKDQTAAGTACSWEAPPSLDADPSADPDNQRCFCGDPDDSPSGGAF